MTEQETLDWLGLGQATRRLLPAIVEGMAGVPFPSTDREHLDVFTAFLEAAGPVGSPVFEPQEGDRPAGGTSREETEMDSKTTLAPVHVTVVCRHMEACEVTRAGGEQILHSDDGEACAAAEFRIVREHQGDRANAFGWLVEKMMTEEARADEPGL
jgi:hypothetical protein